MLDVLPASRSHQATRAKWLTTSMIIHAMVVTLAVIATRGALEATKVAEPEEPMLLFFPRPAPAAEHRPAPAPDVIVEPPAEDFERLPVPSEVPLDIPPINPTQPSIDPRDLVRGESESRNAEGVGSSTEAVARADAIYQATSALVGFEPAVLLSQPTPEYPPTLLSVGVAGVVLLEFVIDTTGKAEAGSVRAIESSHRAFADAARSGARRQVPTRPPEGEAGSPDDSTADAVCGSRLKRTPFNRAARLPLPEPSLLAHSNLEV